jgi:hypothetical protein
VIPVPALRALLSVLVSWSLLFSPRMAGAQEPTAPADRDLDGVADTSDSCPDTYGAPPTGCPPQSAPPPATTTVTPPPPSEPEPTPPVGPRSDRDADGIYDDEDACPDAPSASANGCPEGQGPVVAPVITEPVDPNDEYQQLLRTLPKDFDLNYRYDAPARKRDRDRDPGVAAKQIRALGISGGVLMLAGTVGLISTLSVGLVRANDAKDTLEEMEAAQMTDPGATPDFGAREEALRKGEQGDKIAIIGGATSGATFGLGAALLIGARSLRRKTYGGSGGGGSGSGLSDKSRRNLTLYGALLLVYGSASLIGGAVLIGKDDAKKKKNGKILLGLGGTMAGIGVLMFIPVIISKFKKTAQVHTGPMWVRGGGGAGVKVRF